jgi:flagellar motor switch protein FliG
MQNLADLDPRHLYNLIRDEQAQTIAFVISYLTPDRAAQVLTLLDSEQRDNIIERLATLGPTPIEVAEKVVEVLNSKLGIRQTRALSQTGGVGTAAGILNALDKTLSRALLTGIEQRNPDLGQAIRKKMFTFEDLLRLDPQAIQQIMRETDLRDLALALKSASEPLRKLLLSNISRRGAEAVEEEMFLLTHLRARDVEAAQFRILDTARKLEAEGKIDLNPAPAGEHELV